MPRIILKDAFKTYKVDQDKTTAPGETVRRFRERLRRIDLDILDKTVRIDNGRLGIPVFFSLCGKDAAALTGTGKQMGKGATVEQAEASAVMELAERFSFFSFLNEPSNFITACHQDLKGDVVSFKTIAESVHDTSKEIGIAKKIFKSIPLKWCHATNLTQNRDMLIPINWFFAINEFNGPSAGNCTEEAICQGICEVVERHVSSLISRNRLAVPGIAPESITDPTVIEMMAKYRKNGIYLFLSDFTLDMGIPSVGALAFDPATFPEKSEIVWTAGTTPNPEKALSRTLTEVAQLAGDFNSDSRYVASGLPKLRHLEEAAFIIDTEASLPLQMLPDISDDNIKTEILNCISALSEKKMEVFAVDTTHSRLDIPAYYTIIPGAHFRERADKTGVALFAAKIVSQEMPPDAALKKLTEMDALLPDKYYIKFYQGLCHLSMRRLDDAQSLLMQALSLDPPREDLVSILSYTGVVLKEMERFKDALEVLQKGAELDEERTDIHNLMGFCHYRLKQHAQAIESFKKVLRINPSSAIDYANIASNYRDMGRIQKAIEHYELALELDPGIDFARENLATLKNRISAG